ncbi:MAG: hypothetical protein M1118_15140, partial [Chloroflexi bacterium]|nr:hypothetical protein [Chloroflexota bacterium]
DHHTIHNAVTRCALLLRLPGEIPAGLRVSSLASSMDVTPTILDLCGLPLIQPTEVAGVSLMPLLRGAPSVRLSAPIGEASRQVSHGVVTPEWRLIEPITARTDGTPLPDFLGRPRDPHIQLFDRHSDPHEQHNAATQHPQMVAILKRLMRERLDRLHPYTGVDDPFRHCSLTLDFETMVARHNARATSA